MDVADTKQGVTPDDVAIAQDPAPVPPLTEAEIAEYRRVKPMLTKMLAQWDDLLGHKGCPVAQSILFK